MTKHPRSTLAVVLLAGLMLLAPAAFAQHSVYLQVPNSIPSYCQETWIWCGAATGQMTLEGYPGGVNHVFTQTHIWNRIQAHKDDPGVAWATDPDGLRDTLMELGGDPGVHWVIFADPNAQSLMHTVAYWITQRRFPVPVLVYGFQHWILIEGITTDVDPRTNPSVVLQWIEVTDPGNPPCPTASSGGIKSLMTGSTWYANYWYSPGLIPASKWNGNYVAVVEPPVEEETVARAPRQPLEGQPIDPREAVERAMEWARSKELLEREPYSILRTSNPLEPYLVNAEKKGYYIVPLGYKEGRLSQGAVLVNAYDGQPQEIGVFDHPLQYLDRGEAVRLGLKYLCGCDQREPARAELVFQPSAQTQSRFLPVWRVASERGTVYVTQLGKVFTELTQLPLGD